MDHVRGNVEQIVGRVREACRRAGRKADDVRIVAVSKTFGPELVDEAAAAGLTIFGENRVQEAAQKIPLCKGGLEWHLVGHLQTNKVAPAVEMFHMIHSVDSLRLLGAVDGRCAERGKTMPVCLEVNVSGEGSKYGFAPSEVEPALDECRSLMNVDVVGLMTIPPMTPDPGDSRGYFKRLRELRDELCNSTAFGLEELSMGMSRDFEFAVEEGATLVRIGTMLFGKRER